jgi:DoxX-like protein
MAKVAAILVGRLIFGGIFAMAATSNMLGMDAAASYIAAAGFPFPLLLAWVATLFESALAIGPLPRLRLSRPVALDRQPDGIRVLHRSLHLHRRATVRSGSWARHCTGRPKQRYWVAE